MNESNHIDVVGDIEPSGDLFLDQARREAAGMAASGHGIPEGWVEARHKELSAEIERQRQAEAEAQRDEENALRERERKIKEANDAAEAAVNRLKYIQEQEARLALIQGIEVAPGVVMTPEELAKKYALGEVVEKELVKHSEKLIDAHVRVVSREQIKWLMVSLRMMVLAVFQIFILFVPDPARPWIQIPIVLIMLGFFCYHYREMEKTFTKKCAELDPPKTKKRKKKN